MFYIVLDLEFNQSFPFKTGTKTETDPECPFEIIQIGAVKLNENFEQIDCFDRMISPQLYPRIHPYVEKITGITQRDLVGQPTFPQVYPAFLEFIGKEPAVLCTWGGDDIKSLYRNILYHNLDADAMTDQYLNIQPFAAAYLNHEAGQSIGLKNAVTELGLSEAASYHNALNDAVYTANIFRVVHPENLQPETFRPLTMLAKKPKRLRTNNRALLAYVQEQLARELTDEEKSLVKMAYMLGRNHSFDVLRSASKN